jgi:hypothetical protein
VSARRCVALTLFARYYLTLALTARSCIIEMLATKLFVVIIFHIHSQTIIPLCSHFNFPLFDSSFQLIHPRIQVFIRNLGSNLPSLR